jgi:nanoRNase/pAp phosphatase (c-di-AMP/oligoRNAs hydrolase)
MTILEHDGDWNLLGRVVPLLARRSLADVAALPDLVARWTALDLLHRAFVERCRRRTQLVGVVAFADLTDEPTEVLGKFVSYALFPECSYSVTLSRVRSKCKISVGYNPWAKRARDHDVAAICARHGGGGHAVVGAVSLPAAAVEQARTLALAIAEELNQDPAALIP